LLKTKKSRIFVSSDIIEMVLLIDPPYTRSHQKMINKIIIASTGLQITNRQELVTLSSQTRFFIWPWPVFGQSNSNSCNSCDSEPRLHSSPFITKKTTESKLVWQWKSQVNSFTTLCFSHFVTNATWSIVSAARLFFMRVLSDHPINQTISDFI